MRNFPPTTIATVWGDAGNSTDDYGAPVHDFTNEVWTGRVVVGNLSTADLDEDEHPEGDRIDLVAHFPEGLFLDFRGKRVQLGQPYNQTFDVVGNPMPYPVGLNGCQTPVALKMVEG